MSLKSLKEKVNTQTVVEYRIPMLKAKSISEITGEHTTIRILNQQCKGCELCVTFCPEHILEMGNQLNTKSYFFPHANENKEANCVQCRTCERMCPELSIFLTTDEED